MHRETGIKDLAALRGLPIGACVDAEALTRDPAYCAALIRECNMLVAENVFKPVAIWRGPEEYDFTAADRVAEFARANGMILRGHTLLWHQSVPRWLIESKLGRDDVSSLLRRYIHAVVGRYRGQVASWDVVNEAISNGDAPALRESFWTAALGADTLRLPFEWAHEADPGARLYYNDYEAESLTPKGNAVFDLVRSLKADGSPIHGAGLQYHLICGWRAGQGNRDAIRRLTDLGLEWQVTEADVRIELHGEEPSPARLADQAAAYGDLIRLCIEEPGCSGFSVWGIGDAYSWIPGFRPGWGAALPLDANLRPKPAYAAIGEALRKAV